MLSGSGIQIPRDRSEGVTWPESHTNLLVGDGLVTERLCLSESGFDDLASEVLQLWHKEGDRSGGGAVGTEARLRWRLHLWVQATPLNTIQGSEALGCAVIDRTELAASMPECPARPRHPVPVHTSVPSKEPLALIQRKAWTQECFLIIARL